MSRWCALRLWLVQTLIKAKFNCLLKFAEITVQIILLLTSSAFAGATLGLSSNWRFQSPNAFAITTSGCIKSPSILIPRAVHCVLLMLCSINSDNASVFVLILTCNASFKTTL